MRELILDGDATMAIVALAVVGGVMVVEVLAGRLGWPVWFLPGFPLGSDLVPLSRAPDTDGMRGGVAWRVVAGGRRVQFWAEGGGPLPRGLHGVAWLRPDRMGRVHLDVRWAPPWTPGVALVWFAVLGAVRGEAWITAPLATLLAGALLFAYWRAAEVAAARLRYALDHEPSDPYSGQGGRPS